MERLKARLTYTTSHKNTQRHMREFDVHRREVVFSEDCHLLTGMQRRLWWEEYKERRGWESRCYAKPIKNDSHHPRARQGSGRKKVLV